MAATVLDAIEEAIKATLGDSVRSVFRGDANEDMQQAGRGLPWVCVIDRGERFEKTSESRIVTQEVEVRAEARGDARARQIDTALHTLLDKDPPTLSVAGRSVTWQKPVSASLDKVGDKPEDGEWRWRASLVYSVRTEEAR